MRSLLVALQKWPDPGHFSAQKSPDPPLFHFVKRGGSGDFYKATRRRRFAAGWSSKKRKKRTKGKVCSLLSLGPSRTRTYNYVVMSNVFYLLNYKPQPFLVYSIVFIFLSVCLFDYKKTQEKTKVEGQISGEDSEVMRFFL